MTKKEVKMLTVGSVIYHEEGDKAVITAIDEFSDKYVVDEYDEVYDENDEFIGFSEKRTGISCLTEYDLIHHYYVNIKW